MRFYHLTLIGASGIVATQRSRGGEIIRWATPELEGLVGKRLGTVRGWLSARERVEEIHA